MTDDNVVLELIDASRARMLDAMERMVARIERGHDLAEWIVSNEQLGLDQ